MPHPDVFWYHVNGMGAQKNVLKKVLATLLQYIFHVKSNRNIVYEHLKTKILIFLEDQLQPLGHLGYH